MRSISRVLLAFLSVTLIGMAFLVAPAQAVPAPRAASSPSSTPTAAPSSTPGGPLSGSTAARTTFGIGPAAQVPSDHYVDGRPYITALTSGGGAIRDAVALLNVARKPVTLRVYPADAAQNGSTDFQLTLFRQKLTGAGSWLTVDGRKSVMVTVPASHAGPGGRNIPGRVVVTIQGVVPLHATPGDHAAAIVAELDARARNKEGANITLQQRLGVAVYIHLLGKLVSGIQVSNLTTHWKEPGNALGTSRFTVSFTVANTGNVRLNASTLINTSRWFLGPVRIYPGQINNLFPGTRITVTRTVDGVFGLGPWHTTASVFASTVDPSDNLPVTPSSQTASLWAVPWILLAIIVAIILIALLSWAYYRRLRKRRAKREAEGVGRRKQAKGSKAKGAKTKDSESIESDS